MRSKPDRSKEGPDWKFTLQTFRQLVTVTLVCMVLMAGLYLLMQKTTPEPGSQYPKEAPTFIDKAEATHNGVPLPPKDAP